MKQSVKNMWVDRLRSGEYEQGIGYLNNDGKFCCLGVLCEIAKEAGVVNAVVTPGLKPVSYAGVEDEYDRDAATLPYAVQVWAGLGSENPVVDGAAVSEWNDGDTNDDAIPATFEEIADKIEVSL